MAFAAGSLYAVAAFAIGFVLGALRTLLVAPRIGALAAVLLEAPLILALCWPLSRHCVARFAVPRSAAARALTGAVAFAVLIALEYAMATRLFGRTTTAFAAELATAPGAVGLAAQLLFATFPFLQRSRA